MTAMNEEALQHPDGDDYATDRVRPPQDTEVVTIAGLPVGWAKVTAASAETGILRITQVIIHGAHVEPESNFFFGVSNDDETPQITSPAPTEPGFYKYSGGNQNIIFLLRDEPTDGYIPGHITKQWYVVADNGDIEECHWSYIEQALGVYELVKL